MEDEKVPITEDAVPVIKQKLEDDPDFAALFAEDPGAALDSIGYFVPEELWDEISRITRQGVSAVVDDAGQQIPEGTSRTITVRVSLEDPTSK